MGETTKRDGRRTLDVERQTNGDVVVEDELEASTGSLSLRSTVDENGGSRKQK
jgi:hypothetical protein